MATIGLLLYQRHGQRHFVPVNVNSLAKAQWLAIDLKAYTDAKITDCYYVEVESTGDTAEGAHPNSVERYARVQFQAVDDTSADPSVWLKIPAPVESMFEAVEDKGYRITEAVGAELARIYSKITGMKLVFVDGWLYGGAGRLKQIVG